MFKQTLIVVLGVISSVPAFGAGCGLLYDPARDPPECKPEPPTPDPTLKYTLRDGQTGKVAQGQFSISPSDADLERIKGGFQRFTETCPNFLRYHGGVTSVQAHDNGHIDVSQMKDRKNPDWDRMVTIAVKLSNDAKLLPPDAGVTGHTVFFEVGQGPLTAGVRANKSNSARFCDFPLKTNGRNEGPFIPTDSPFPVVTRRPPSDPKAAARWCEWLTAQVEISRELDRRIGHQKPRERLEADSEMRRAAINRLFTKNGYDMKAVSAKAKEENWSCP